MKNLFFTILLVGCLQPISLQAQSAVPEPHSDTITLTLPRVIELARDQSVSAFYAQNSYLRDYWQYRSYRAGRLPSLILSSTPIKYSRDIVRRYDSENNIEVFRPQQSLFSQLNLSIVQNFDLIGGSFFIDSELGYFHNLGNDALRQFTSIPIRVGYRHSLLGYNPFKWEREIEPLKYRKASQEFISSLEQVSEEVTGLFFNLLMAQTDLQLTQDRAAEMQKLYDIGQERFKIASITQADLYTLKLDLLNARNSRQNALITFQQAKYALMSYLGISSDKALRLEIPSQPQEMPINQDEAIAIAQMNNPEYLDSRQKILEAEQEVDRTRRESLFQVGVSLSVGFNQAASTLVDVYRAPRRQDLAGVTITIPILDWGVRKGRYNVAKSNLRLAELSREQKMDKLQQDLTVTLGDLEIQRNLFSGAQEAVRIARIAYAQTQERFVIGKTDVNTLSLSSGRMQEAQRNYIQVLKSYWQSFFRLRKLTLYDFVKQQKIEIPMPSVE